MKTALIVTFISSFLFLVFFGRLLKLDNAFKYRQKFSINWVFAAAAVIFTFCIYAYKAYWGGNLSAGPPGPVSSLITGNFSEAVLSVIFLGCYLILVFIGRFLKLDVTFKPQYNFSVNWIFFIMAGMFTAIVYLNCV